VTIEVVIRHKESGAELGHIDIENVSEEKEDTGDYSVRFAVEKITGVGIHQRAIFNFPRREFNVLALLLQALNTLEPRDLAFSGEWEHRDPMEKLKQLGRRWWQGN
jgi:hypothetical protein